MPLDEALDRALKIYDAEHLHAAPVDVAAKHMGYKDANNGAALSALASLRYYGLVERPKEGLLNVSRDVEAYKFAPTEDLRRSFLLRFITTPPLFAELIDRYGPKLPSDGTLKYELIQRGFLPGPASSLVAVLKQSIEFAGLDDGGEKVDQEPSEEVTIPAATSVSPTERGASSPAAGDGNVGGGFSEEPGHDRIPVRLPGARRAWLIIPSPFFEADKQRLKAQIDLLLTAEDEHKP
jgi:hypothetical protein